MTTSTAGSASTAASGGIHLEMANSSLSGDSIPLWVAKDGGYFQKNGLDVNIQLISGAAASMATLISGKVEFGNLGGSAVITSAAGGATGRGGPSAAAPVAPAARVRARE